MTKMTKKDFYEVLSHMVAEMWDAEFALDCGKSTTAQEILDFLDYERGQLIKRSTTRKPTKNQRENAELAAVVLDYLKNADGKKRISDIQQDVPEVANLSSQRMAAILKTLTEQGALAKTVEKRVSYWQVA